MPVHEVESVDATRDVSTREPIERRVDAGRASIGKEGAR